jgi:Protein of unknown function (DUF2975)
MSTPLADSLALARRLLGILIPLNLLVGCLILLLLVASIAARNWAMTALGTPPTASNQSLIFGMRLIMVIGVMATPLTHIALTRLLAIVQTVNAGDPFVAENADRLHQIAWAVLVLQALHVVVGVIIASASTSVAPLRIGWRFSFAPWLAVLLLFVLARVFEYGAQMRDDLDGTV